MNQLQKLFTVFLPEAGFRRSFFTLFKTNILLQVLTVAPYPLLARLYTPEDFSTFALYNSILLVLLVVATGKYDAAIVIAKKVTDAVRLISLTLVIAVSVSVVLGLLLLMDASGIAEISVPETYLYTIPAMLLLAAVLQTGRNYYNRKGYYQAYSRSHVMQRASSVIVAISAGWKGFAFNGLVLGAICGFIVSGFAVLFSFGNVFKKKNWFRNIRKIAVAYQDFPKYSAPLSLLNILSAQLPLYIIYHYFNETLAGHYAMAYRLLSIPESIVSASIAVVFYREFAKVVDKRSQALKLVTGIWKKQLLIGLVPFVLVLLFGNELIVIVLGEKWRIAGEMLVLLSTIFFVQFISLPTSSALTALRKLNVSFYFGFSSLIIRAVMLWVAFQSDNLFTGLKLFVVLEVLQVLIYNLFLVRELKKSIN